MPPFKAIIFDLDNTLLDFMELKKRSCDAAVTAMIDAGLGIKKGEALKKLFFLYDRYGIEDHLIFQKFLKKTIGKVSYPILAAGIVAYRNVRSSYLIPYPHVHQALQELQRRGTILCILTDAPRLKAWIRIAALRLMPYFTHVITYDDTKTKKPSPLPFQKMLQTINLEPPACLMVGDMIDRDIAGAKQIGIQTCWARYGAEKKDAANVDYIIDDIIQLLDIH